MCRIKRENRFVIYEQLLKIAKEDYKYATKRDVMLRGFCWWLRTQIRPPHSVCNWKILIYRNIRNYPELMKYNPNPKARGKMWFAVYPPNKKRIEVLEEILKTK